MSNHRLVEMENGRFEVQEPIIVSTGLVVWYRTTLNQFDTEKAARDYLSSITVKRVIEL